MRTPHSIAIPALVGGEILRRGLRSIRAAAPYRWRYSGSVPEKLIAVPDILYPAIPSEAENIYSGHFFLAGRSVSTGGESPFAIKVSDPEWRDELHGFRWLRHLNAADTQLARANAKAFVSDWIALWSNRLDSHAWKADIVAARLISWLAAAPLVVDDAGPADYRSFMKALGRQSRYLQKNYPLLRDGYPRLVAAIALAYCSLCFSGREKMIRTAVRELDRELSRQIMPDGGHISRNPAILLTILADLLPLRSLYGRQGQTPPPQLQIAIDRMAGAIRFFRHSNGDLAQFNGTGSTPRDLLQAVLSAAGGATRAGKSAPSSGYERLAMNKTVVLVDTGRPESRISARRAMAGTLSIELSSGQQRFITNCGVPDVDYARYAPYFRATAAHSTATIADTSSSRYATSDLMARLLPSPLLQAPDNVSVKRDMVEGYERIVASHDGYRRRFGLLHERELLMGNGGNEFNGIDRFIAERKSATAGRDFAIRFHLPPDISASRLSSGHSILLAAQDGSAWTLSCIDAPMSIEESVHFSEADHPRRAEQVVISGNTAEHDEVRWSFMQRQRKDSKARTSAEPSQTLPDLLDVLTEADAPAG